MGAQKGKSDKRKSYFSRLYALLDSYPRILIVAADHVGSRQIANIRVALRGGKGVLLMGKNTMIRTALRQRISAAATGGPAAAAAAGGGGSSSSSSSTSTSSTATTGNSGSKSSGKSSSKSSSGAAALALAAAAGAAAGGGGGGGGGLEQKQKLEKLLPLVKLNIGFVFCGVSPGEVKEIINQHKVPAPARQGVIAPVDVYIPAGPTGMDPGSTSFFQALGIATKIVKGQIEIQSDVHLIKKNEKVSASAATLLQKLGIKPFEYGLGILHVYDNGSVYNASVLDVTDNQIRERFAAGAMNVAALSRSIGLPTAVSAPHAILEGFRYCAALVLNTSYVFPQMKKLKEIVENPEAYAAAAAAAAPAAAAAAGGGGAGKGGADAGKKKKEEPEEEEEEEDMGFSLFD